MREFRDAEGITWTVRQIVRTGNMEGAVRPGLEQGWLLFDSGTMKRRFGPVPPSWEKLDDAMLARVCAQALPARPTDGMLRMEAGSNAGED